MLLYIYFSILFFNCLFLEYRVKFDYCLLVFSLNLAKVTFLYLVFCRFLRFSENSFTSCFLIFMLSSFSVLAKIYSKLLNKNTKNGYFYIVLDHRVNTFTNS